MPAAIFGDRFLSRQRPAWHNLGSTFELNEQMTCLGAVERAGLDYTVLPRKIYYELGDKQKKYEVADKVAIVRMPTHDDPEPRYFGEASAAFRVLQNTEAAKILDTGLGQRYAVETVGALGNGEKIFLALRGDDFAVADVDEIKSYFVVEINHRPGYANRVLYTPVRVVCQNTLSMATRQASVNLQIPHIGNPASLLDFGQKVAEQMAKAKDDAAALFNAMATSKITPDQLQRILEAAWPTPPTPKKAKLAHMLNPEQMQALLDGPSAAAAQSTVRAMEDYDYNLTRVAAFRDGARELYVKFNDEHPLLAGTVWAAYNAATECSDWRNGGKKVDESILFGLRADEKKRAFTQAVAEVNVSLN